MTNPIFPHFNEISKEKKPYMCYDDFVAVVLAKTVLNKEENNNNNSTNKSGCNTMHYHSWLQILLFDGTFATDAQYLGWILQIEALCMRHIEIAKF